MYLSGRLILSIQDQREHTSGFVIISILLKIEKKKMFGLNIRIYIFKTNDEETIGEVTYWDGGTVEFELKNISAYRKPEVTCGSEKRNCRRCSDVMRITFFRTLIKSFEI